MSEYYLTCSCPVCRTSHTCGINEYGYALLCYGMPLAKEGDLEGTWRCFRVTAGYSQWTTGYSQWKDQQIQSKPQITPVLKLKLVEVFANLLSKHQPSDQRIWELKRKKEIIFKSPPPQDEGESPPKIAESESRKGIAGFEPASEPSQFLENFSKTTSGEPSQTGSIFQEILEMGVN